MTCGIGVAVVIVVAIVGTVISHREERRKKVKTQQKEKIKGHVIGSFHCQVGVGIPQSLMYRPRGLYKI